MKRLKQIQNISEHKKTVAIRLEPSIISKIQTIAGEKGIAFVDVIREAIIKLP